MVLLVGPDFTGKDEDRLSFDLVVVVLTAETPYMKNSGSAGTKPAILKLNRTILTA